MESLSDEDDVRGLRFRLLSLSGLSAGVVCGDDVDSMPGRHRILQRMSCEKREYLRQILKCLDCRLLQAFASKKQPNILQVEWVIGLMSGGLSKTQRRRD